MSEWQPIETAPKDRRRIVAFVPDELGDHQIQIAEFDDDYASLSSAPFWRYNGDGFASGRYSRAHQPSHWMPLPEPPR